MAKERKEGVTVGKSVPEMAYKVTKKNQTGSVIEVTVTSGKYEGKSATIAQISSLCAYYNKAKK